MVQAIQLSMLTTSADNALRLDGAPSDSAAGAGSELSGAKAGQGFDKMLNGMTAPATNGQPGAKLRHIPAGISVLNGVSQALLAAQAKDDNATSAENAQSAEHDSAAGSAEGSLLTSSLLGQIALKDKLPETGRDSDNTAETAIGDVEDEPATVVPGNTQPEIDADTEKTAKTAQQPAQSASETTDSAAELQVKASSLISADVAPGNLTDKTAASVGGKGEAQPVAVLTGATESGISQDDVNNIAVAQSAKETGTTGNDHPANGSNSKDSTIKAAIATGIKADGDNNKIGDNDIKAVDSSTKAGSVVQADIKAVTADSPQQTAVNTAPGTVVSNAATTEERGKPDADTVTTSSKLSLTAASDKADHQMAAKAGSEQNAFKHDAQQQNGSQQNGQQSPKQNNAELPADITEVPDSNVAAAKVAADGSATARSETAFTSALHLAEQRQQAGPVQTVARPLAEQLKQSLNLLQQDATGQLRERVSLMVRQNIQIAEIRLDPAGLGMMQIKIDMQQDQASVQFIVQQSQAKELLEQQMPRLREMLQQQGIQLAEGQVQQQSQQERQLAQRDNNNPGRGGKHTDDDGQDGLAETVQLNVNTSDRLVDYYA